MSDQENYQNSEQDEEYRLQKQNFLVSEILQKKYNAQAFMDFCNSLKEGTAIARQRPFAPLIFFFRPFDVVLA